MVRDVAYVDVPGSRDEVLKTLQKSRVSGVPVVKKGCVVGMITRSDLLKNREEDQIALLMTRNPVVVGPGATVIEASKLLVEHGIRRLPVVEDGKLVGMVTIADIIEVVSEMGINEKIDELFQRRVVVLWSETPTSSCRRGSWITQVGACLS
jgi:predicted transcriptional regulator